MEKKCFICHGLADIHEQLLFVQCVCPNCGSYAYEKNFVTTYEYYHASNNHKNEKKLIRTMQKIIARNHACFVDDFETADYEGYKMYELRDVLNMAGFEITHNNTIDSNWKD